MRALSSPRDDALAAIEAFGRSSPVLASRDQKFLDRLRSVDYESAVCRVWSTVRKHRRTSDDDVLIIKNTICALNIARTYWPLPDRLNEQKHRDREAKKAMRCLCDYFQSHRSVKADRLRESLSWASSVIERSGERFGDLRVETNGMIMSARGEMPSWLRLSRERKTPASQRVMFMAAMSKTFSGLFGKPCHLAVAALTDIAFETAEATTIEQVRAAAREHTQPISKMKVTGQLARKKI